jgi:hypothetical protein
MPVFAITGTAYFCDGFAFDDIEARDEAHARERVEELVHEQADRHHCLTLNEVCIDSVTMHPEPSPADLASRRDRPRHPLPWRIIDAGDPSGTGDLVIVDADGSVVCTLAGTHDNITLATWGVAQAIINSVNPLTENGV